MYSLSCIAKVLQSVKTAIFLIKIVQESILYGDITQTSSEKSTLCLEAYFFRGVKCSFAIELALLKW